jgi:hypothetical protein
VQHVVKKDKASGKSEQGTVYLLSNYLESGRLIGDNDIWQNYRLVSNIIFLGGSDNVEPTFRNNLYNGMKTAAYALVTKPCDKIAKVSLQALMRMLYENEERKPRDITDEEIRKRLGINRNGSFKMGDEIFESKISGYLPSASDLVFLPFSSMKEYKDIKKSKQVNEARLNRATYGAWTSYVEWQYCDMVDRFWSSDVEVVKTKCEISTLLTDSFSLFDLLYLSDRVEDIKRIFISEYIPGGSGSSDDYMTRLHAGAVSSSKTRFYEHFKQAICDVFFNIMDEAKDFDKAYTQSRDEVSRAVANLGDEADGIVKLYETEVRKFIEIKKPINSNEAPFPEVFHVSQGKEELLGTMYRVFQTLLADNKVFKLGFEEELELRLEQASEKFREQFIDNEVRGKVRDNRRLNTIASGIDRLNSYFLVNRKARYAKQLAARDEYGRDFLLFDINRTDCIEQIEIFNITKPQDLNLAAEHKTRGRG